MIDKFNTYNTFLYKTNYVIDWDLLRPIANISVDILEQHYLEVNGVTSYKNTIATHTIPELKSFYDFLKPIYTNIIVNKWGYPKNAEYYIQNAWFSRYESNGFVDIHDHTDSIAVACLYIKLPKNGGNIEFLDPYYDYKKQYIKDDKFLFNKIDVFENDVVIFGGKEKHRSQPNLSDEERWTLTSNIGIKKNNLI